jgi:SAM-dependent methyltransferase
MNLTKQLKINSMKNYSEKNLKLFSKTILDDEFDDMQQNENAYQGTVSGANVLIDLINKASSIITDAEFVLNVGSGGHHISEYFPKAQTYDLDPCPARVDNSTIEGWCENMDVKDKGVDFLICWGTLCFVRSLPETLIEFNRVLKEGGFICLDVVTYTTMPLPQTVNPDCFPKYVGMYGFDVWCRVPFGFPFHKRDAFLLRKTRDFDPAYLRMPQGTSKINNFLLERDWFMR